MPTQQDAVAAARAHRRAHGAEILADFAALLAMPNVSRDVADVTANAEAIAASFRKRGVDVDVVSEGGAGPVVVGDIAGGAQGTIGLYVHYDGQPVEPGDWTFPPFTPTLCTAPLTAGGTPRPLPAAGEPIDDDWRLYAHDIAGSIGSAQPGGPSLGYRPVAKKAGQAGRCRHGQQGGADRLGCHDP